MREAAHRHGIYATFMAKPMSNEPGSAMHIHQSLEDMDGNNLFGTSEGATPPSSCTSSPACRSTPRR